MPGYGSLRSPSLRKMEHSRASYGRRSFSLGNIIGDPFALATTSIAFLAWLIAFVGCIIGQITTNTRADPFPTYAWWAVVYMPFVILGILFAIAADSVQTYHVAIVGYVSCGLVLTSSSVNNLVYSPHGSREAAAAGFILLSMVLVSKTSACCITIETPVSCQLVPIFHEFHPLMVRTADCVDLLLRSCPVGHASSVPRLFRAD
jgi:SHO1 osmosensor